MVLFETNLFHIADCVSVPTFCRFLIVCGCFWRFHFHNFVTKQLVGLEFCAFQQDTFYPHEDCEQNIFPTEIELYFIGWSLRNWKIAAYLQFAEKWDISTKARQSSF